jgi:hypothetical protein
MPCHFCTDPGISYGLCGLGERPVRVIEWIDPSVKGYEELGEGWCSDNEEYTRMCALCTTARLLIMTCAEHKIRPIAGLDPRTFDFDKPYRQVFEKLESREGKLNRDSTKRDAGMQMADKTKWCSICIAPAFFECCVPQIFNKFGEPAIPGGEHGCGLLLCEVCASKMEGKSPKGQKDKLTAESASEVGADCSECTRNHVFTAAINLEQLIAAAMNDSIHYEVGLRADVSFLTNDGELRRSLDAEHRVKNGIYTYSDEYPYPFTMPEVTQPPKRIRRRLCSADLEIQDEDSS